MNLSLDLKLIFDCMMLSNFPDINECNDTELVHECDHTCINTIGSYACTCNSGYNLNVDGRTCDGTLLIVLLLESLQFIFTCFSVSDIDECANNNDLCAQACINTPGSYTCDCNPGYTLDPNGFSCIGEMIICSTLTICYIVCPIDHSF